MSNRIGILLVITIVALLAYVFDALIEPYEKNEDLGWDTAALRNPYLAAEQYLLRQQEDVKSFDSFEKLDHLPENGTLFISNSTSVISGKRLDELVGWIKEGGHLIVAAGAPDDNESDRILQYFSIEVVDSEYEGSAGDEALEEIDIIEEIINDDEASDGQSITDEKVKDQKDNIKSEKKLSERLREHNRKLLARADEETEAKEEKVVEIPAHELTDLYFGDEVEPLTLHFSPYRHLFHPYFIMEENEEYEGYQPVYWGGSEHGNHFVQIEVERGMISVLSDPNIWKSDEIDDFDHAYLLTLLCNDAGAVRLLYGMNMPSVFVLIWRYGQELVISLGLFLMAWLVYRGRRFGPIIDLRVTERRSIAEHIHASASHLWRGRWTGQLLMPLREEIQHQARCKLASYELLDQEQQYTTLSELSGIALEQVHYAMTTHGDRHEGNFLKTVQCLQKIRKSL